MSKEGRDLKTAYQWEAKSQWKGKQLDHELEIYITLYFGTKRKCDWDNFHKLSMDALTGVVWKDDSQIKDAHISVRYDKTNPRITIEVVQVACTRFR
jgi:Holliday junction resolvase RusA-like endonuclease